MRCVTPGRVHMRAHTRVYASGVYARTDIGRGGEGVESGGEMSARGGEDGRGAKGWDGVAGVYGAPPLPRCFVI